MTGALRRAVSRVVPRTVRGKALVALVAAFGVAAVISTAMDIVITERRLTDEGGQLVADGIRVATAVIEDDRTRLRIGLQNNAQNLQVLGVDPASPSAVVRRELGQIRRNLGTDGIGLVDAGGRVLASSGEVPASPVGPPDAAAGEDLRVVPGVGGGLLELVAVPIDGRTWLTAVRDFGAPRAFDLRRVLAADEVVLVADGRVVGATIDVPEAVAVRAAAAGSTVSLDLADADAVAGFARLGQGVAVGVVSARPLGGLEADLVSAQLIVFLALLVVAVTAGNAAFRVVLRPLEDLTRTAEAVRGGERERPFAAEGDDEIARLAGTLEAMRTSLADQVAVIGLQAAAIRSATSRIVSARDAERRRMAADLHDGVQQQLVMLRLRIGMMGPGSDAEEVQALGRDVEEVMRRLRETAQAIFPSILADRGIAGALWSLAATAAIPVEVDLVPDPLPRLAEQVETGAYFIVSEAVTNAVKHAGARRLRVRARVDDRRLLLMVADDGEGFDVDGAGGDRGSGLVNLRDRAVALGGIAHVRSEPGVGTVVAVRIPLPAGSVGAALQEEEDGGDAAVEVVGVAEAELAEDGVRVLLDGALGDDERLGDR